MDTEFLVVKGLLPVTWSVSIRRIDGKSLFYTTIKYPDKSIADIGKQVRRHLKKSYRTKDLFRMTKAGLTGAIKHYCSTQTHGLTIKETRAKIKELGYSPKRHKLLCWYTTMDYVLF